MKNFILLAGVAAIVAGGVYFYMSQQNGQNPFGTAASEQTTNNAQNSTAPSSTSNSISGIYCHTDDADRTLAIHKEDGSPDILFGTSYWYANGQSCGVSNAHAKLIDDQKWFFIHEMANGSKCGLEIEALPDGSVKVTESEVKCTDLCGAGVNFGDAIFPPSSKYKDTATKDEAMQAGELELCP